MNLSAKATRNQLIKAKIGQIVSIWVAVYPIITVLTFALDPLTTTWAIPAKTLLTSALMVPLMILWVMPIVNSLKHNLRRLTKKGSDHF